MAPGVNNRTSERDDDSQASVGPHSDSYPAHPRDPDPPKKKRSVGKGPIIFFGIAALLLVVVIVDIADPDSSNDRQGEELPQRTEQRPETTGSRPETTATSTATESRTRETPSAASNSVTQRPQPTPLNPPSGLVTIATSDSFTLRWDTVDRAVDYEVRLSDTSALCRPLQEDGPGIECTDLSPEATYSVSIRAIPSTGRSSNWTVEHVTTLPRPVPQLPPTITIELNERYDDIDPSAVEAAMATMVAWYEHEYGLTAELPSVIRFEPQCNPTTYLDVLGYATPGKGPQGEDVIDVCVRLDEDNDAVLETEQFRWLIAHEYFHVLQANANWAYEDFELTFGSVGACGRHLVEGSAEYFSQIYTWGELREAGLLDNFFDLFLEIDWERQYYYDDGAKAFAALIRWKGADKAVRFWESDESRCSDAFLSAFDVTPAKYEADWKELTKR